MTTLENRTHALAMTTEAEVQTVREVLLADGLLGETVRYAFFAPEEPPKDDVLGGTPCDRRFRVVLLDLSSGRSWDTVVSTDTRSVVSRRELDPPRDGQPPIIDAEFEFIEGVLLDEPEWRAALERRGIDPASVRAVPLSAGAYDDYPETPGRRVVRAFGFRQDHERDHPWAHPIDGLVAYVDLTARVVDRIIDEAPHPVPETTGNFDDPEVQGSPLDLKPIEITQPEGRSFTVEDGHVRWGKWDARTRHARHGCATARQTRARGCAREARPSTATAHPMAATAHPWRRLRTSWRPPHTHGGDRAPHGDHRTPLATTAHPIGGVRGATKGCAVGAHATMAR